MLRSVRGNRARGGRRGYVLFAVLVVTVVLSLTAYRYTDSMVTENTVAVRSAEQIQAKLAAVSGVHYAAGVLADPNSMSGMGYDPSDNQALFAGVAVGTSRFSLVNVSESLDGAASGEARYPRRYGISDEGGKININALIQADPQGDILYAALLTLPLPANYPYTKEQVADSIVDWVDADTTTRPNGLEDYSGMAQQSYLCKNGPISTLDELLLVQGVTPQLLYGNDRNRNGVQDAGEADGGDFSRGWSEYLTCYGREINVNSAGTPRINLNSTDLATLSQQLTALVGQELSDYILYYRISGSGQGAAPALAANQVAAPPSTLSSLVQTAITNSQMPKLKVNSVITVWNTQIALPAPPPMRGQPPQPQQIIACPLNDPAVLNEKLALLLDNCTTSDQFELTPRINVNTAPLSVLTALPGLTETDVNTIISSRAGQSLSDPAVSTGAWLVTVAQMPPDKFRALEQYISGRSWTYRVHSVGSSGPAGTPGRVARVEAVIDVGTRSTDGTFTGYPRIVYFRDLTDLGRGFADLP